MRRTPELMCDSLRTRSDGHRARVTTRRTILTFRDQRFAGATVDSRVVRQQVQLSTTTVGRRRCSPQLPIRAADLMDECVTLVETRA